MLQLMLVVTPLDWVNIGHCSGNLEVAKVVELFFRSGSHCRDEARSPLPRLETVIFIHRSFWHRHLGCRYAANPKTRQAVWSARFDVNVARDRRVSASFRHLGWSVITVWGCHLRKPERVGSRLGRMLAARASAVQPRSRSPSTPQFPLVNTGWSIDAAAVIRITSQFFGLAMVSNCS